MTEFDQSPPSPDNESKYYVFPLRSMTLRGLKEGVFIYFPTIDDSRYLIELQGSDTAFRGSDMAFAKGLISRRGEDVAGPDGIILTEFDDSPVRFNQDWAINVGQSVMAFAGDKATLPTFTTSPISKSGILLVVPDGLL